MSSQRVSHFQEMLVNERSFDRLFCDLHETSRFDLYYNEKFRDDPVFNHAVMNNSVLDTSEKQNAEQTSELLREIGTETARRNVPTSVFVEDFWENSWFFQKVAVENHYFVGGTMEILSKSVRALPETASKTTIEETKNLELWNQVFMRSYSIPHYWEEELVHRERMFLAFLDTRLLIARDLQNQAVGCMLIHKRPAEYLGVYCVGTIPQVRHRGVAKSMLIEAEKTATALGCNYLTLQTISSDGVTPLYLKLGYNVEFRRIVLQLR